MQEKINWKAFAVGLIVLLVGILIVVFDIFKWRSPQLIGVSIGCSLIASGLVITLNTLVVERKKEDPLHEWGIEKIYSTRAERNAEADPNIDKARHSIDGVAFGLSNFRAKYSAKIETALRHGVNIRLLVMDPESDFLSTREIEEGVAEGTIRGQITELIRWAERLNQNKHKGSFTIRGYNCMTLDYYWRVDDDLYIGPYWYGYQSSNTITFKFKNSGKGYQHYSEYFTSLWENEKITRVLVEPKYYRLRR